MGNSHWFQDESNHRLERESTVIYNNINNHRITFTLLGLKK